ncbi:hypothetical protein [Streptomyces sp. NRRL WC-3549]|uniref:hypothetical protein n=1 Tax=Streptomyces sp. NRRL WC-3549 TaxID=1463925 RepID=UPI0009E8D357|nr:hypothetical protein [Streptomyces sp. NRRL WC-3549]
MPRRRPGALRAEDPVPPVWGPWTGHVPGLSERACAEVARVEREQGELDVLWVGAVEAALRHYRAFLRQPGRHLGLYFESSPHPESSLVDVANARDLLQEALRLLPAPTRAELGRLVAPLDAQLRRRTLPDPHAWRRFWRGDEWWHQRLYDGECGW